MIGLLASVVGLFVAALFCSFCIASSIVVWFRGVYGLREWYNPVETAEKVRNRETQAPSDGDQVDEIEECLTDLMWRHYKQSPVYTCAITPLKIDRLQFPTGLVDFSLIVNFPIFPPLPT